MARMRVVRMAVAAGLILSLGACSSSSKTATTTTGGAGAATTTTAGSGGGIQVTTTVASGTTVNVVVSDTKGLGGKMTVVATPASVKAGDVTFVVKNTGTIDHEVIVLKTTVPYNKIPVADTGDPPAPVTTGANKVDETNNIGETGNPNLKPGESRSFTIKNMTAGTYALVCNIAQHYAKGMRAPFTVT